MPKKKDNTIEILASVLEEMHSPEFDLGVVMETVLTYILKLTHATTGSVLLKDEAENTLRLVAAHGDKRILQGMKEQLYPADKGIQGIVSRTGEPYFSKDVNSDEHYLKTWEDVKSELVLPLKTGDQVIGVLSLECSHSLEFNDKDMTLLKLFADQVSSAIRMQRLYNIQEIRRIEHELLLKETCFVLMPFSDPFNKYYSAVIAPAIETAGLNPVRADSLFGPTNIIEDISQGIKKARLLIAELTTRNPNVMYELGMAHAIGKPVVLLTQNIEDVPFDLRSIRCIVYDTVNPDWANQLREGIKNHIESVLKQGKQKKRFQPFAR